MVFAVLGVVVVFFALTVCLGAAALLLAVVVVLIVVAPLVSASSSHLPAGVLEVVLEVMLEVLGVELRVVEVLSRVAFVVVDVTLSLRSICTNLSSSTSVSFVLDSPILQLSQSTVRVRAGCGLSAFNLVNVPINHSAILAAMR